jgi:hypothetical protein
MQPLAINHRMTVISRGQYLDLLRARFSQPSGHPPGGLSDIIGMLRQTGDAGNPEKLQEFFNIAWRIIY